MREILFRGKRQDNGEWITGHLLRYENGRARINPSHTDIFRHEKDDSIIQTVSFRVDPNTVGQYTELYVAYGKKLFEGDIVKMPKSGAVGLVVWNISNAKFVVMGDSWVEEMCFIDTDNLEIIGNRWDNPEILKEAGIYV